MPTYDIAVAYQFPGDRHHSDFETWKLPLSTTVALEVSLNDVVCEATMRPLKTGASVSIRVCSLEDIIAEKLRALLQQPIRGRHRKQDVYDIARMTREYANSIDKRKIARFLIEKAKVRDITPSRRSFNDEIRSYAAQDYDELEALFGESNPGFISFDDAWQEVVSLVSSLDIPA
jgi:predicted nucleotidyltransferase component of viral defense system